MKMFNNNITGAVSSQPNPYQQVLIEVWRLIKLHNGTSLLSITQEDLSDLCQNLQKDYSLDLLKRAKDEIKSFYANKHLTIGIFLEKCMALKRADQDHIQTQAIIENNTRKVSPVAKEKLAEIKQILDKAIKPLPYNKNMRIYTSTYDYRKDPFVMQPEEITNPELRALYEKASVSGLEQNEKTRFCELRRQYEHVTLSTGQT